MSEQFEPAGCAIWLVIILAGAVLVGLAAAGVVGVVLVIKGGLGT